MGLIAHLLERAGRRFPQLKGAVVATGDGLVLAATGELAGDAPAACAASLSTRTDEALSTVEPVRSAELLIWTPAGPWYLVHLRRDHLLLARGRTGADAEVVRRIGLVLAERLDAILARW